jgi:hypothetical protein
MLARVAVSNEGLVPHMSTELGMWPKQIVCTQETQGGGEAPPRM